ncbi:lipopolysaccharide biosynthesis protein [Rhodopirellula europaea]|nr:lipopolysaccharide biosynthesis protein [Rhodopirellula europaea]
MDILIRQSVTFAVSIVMARLLSPAEFGTVALLAIFLAVATIFTDCGFSSALIQSQNVSHDDESTIFWFNLSMGLVICLLLITAAPSISSFYEVPSLTPITYLLAGNIWLTSLGSIHSTLLTKRLEFRTLMKVGLIASISSGVVGISMALWNFGVWSLVGMTLSGTASSTGLLWMLHSWRPRFVFKTNSLRRFFRFGGYLLASGLMDAVYTKGYAVLIGRFFGVRELGFYNRANTTQQMPVGILTNILSRVAFPLFSAANAKPAKLRRGAQIAVQSITMISVPALLGLAAVADPFVLVVFGKQWLSAAPILEVLCIAGLFWPLHIINLNLLKATGHSDLFFRLEVIKKVIGIASLVVGASFGVMGIAYSHIFFNCVGFAINSFYTGKHLNYGFQKQLADVLPVVLTGGIMAAIIKSLDHQIDLVDAARLPLLVAIGIVSYAGIGLILLPNQIRTVRQVASRPS